MPPLFSRTLVALSALWLSGHTRSARGATDCLFEQLVGEAQPRRNRGETDLLREKIEPQLRAMGLELVEEVEHDQAGHSRIFFARDASGKLYVVKTPKPGLDYPADLNLTPRLVSQEAYVRALAREIEIAARVGKHPNLVELPERLGADREFPILVIPHVGNSLKLLVDKPEFALVRDPPRPNVYVSSVRQKEMRKAQREVVRILLQVTEGLAHLHGKGYVHGDIKPQNIVVGPDGIARLIDFGLTPEIGLQYPAGARTDPTVPPGREHPGQSPTCGTISTGSRPFWVGMVSAGTGTRSGSGGLQPVRYDRRAQDGAAAPEPTARRVEVARHQSAASAFFFFPTARRNSSAELSCPGCSSSGSPTPICRRMSASESRSS